MSAKTNQWKLGLFVSAGMAAAVGVLLWLGASTFRQDIHPHWAIFDESVNGLDVGSPVKYRGVTIGTVAEIDFLSDQRTVLVQMDIYENTLRALGLREENESIRDELEAAGDDKDEDMAVQLASAGITGGKYIQADIFDLTRYPRIQASVPLPDFIGEDQFTDSVPSNLKNLEETIYVLSESLPQLVSEVDMAVTEITELTTTVQGLADGEVRELLGDVIEKVEQVPVTEISEHVVSTLDELERTIAGIGDTTQDFREQGRVRLNELADEITSLSQSLAAAVQEAQVGETTAALRDSLAHATTTADTATALMADMKDDGDLLTEEIQLTARELRRSLDAVSRLARLLERDPGALLRGRTNSATPPRNP